MAEPEKSDALYVMATNLRHAAAETAWAPYREKMLKAARDVERQAEKLDHQSLARTSHTG